MHPPPPPPGDDMPPPGWEPGKDLLALVQKEDKEFWADVEKLSATDEDRFRVEIFRWKQRYVRLQALRAEDPDRAKRFEQMQVLERQTRRLIEGLRQSPEAGAAQAKGKALANLSELFDLREEDRRDEISHLEKRIADLKDSVKDRRSHKDEILKRRMAELLRGDDPLRW